MKNKVITEIMLALLFIGMLALAFNIQIVEAEELWKRPIVDNLFFNADLGDVDGDGTNDVAIVPCDFHTSATPNNLQIIKSDGTTLWTKSLLVDGNGIALEDVDLDGKCEVFAFGYFQLGNYGGILYALDHDGTSLWSFNPGDNYWSILNIASFMNLDMDPELEIVVVEIGWSRYWTYALDTDGALLWKYKTDFYMSDMAIGDITGDGDDEIILFTFKDLHILDKQGNILRQQTLHDGIYGAIGDLGDVTGDGIDDFVVGVNAYDSSFHNTLYVYRNDGTLLWQKGYQPNIDGRIQNLIVLDIDNDGIEDVVVSANRTIYAYRNDGVLLWAFGNGSLQTTVVEHLDINRDGKEEVVFTDGDWIGIGIGHGPAYAGPYIIALSLGGEKILNFTLPDNGRWIFPGCSHTRQAKRFYLFGDTNDDDFDELIIQEIIDGQFYVAVVIPPYPIVTAVVDVKPDTLNLRSKVKWITAYMELPARYNVGDIDVSTVRLNVTAPAELEPIKIGDYDGDGILDLMVKFDKAKVIPMLSIGEAMLTITGKINGTPFEGSDRIRVKD